MTNVILIMIMMLTCADNCNGDYDNDEEDDDKDDDDNKDDNDYHDDDDFGYDDNQPDRVGKPAHCQYCHLGGRIH